MKWRDHPYALYLRGRRRKLEPLTLNKNATRHNVCITY